MPGCPVSGSPLLLGLGRLCWAPVVLDPAKEDRRCHDGVPPPPRLSALRGGGCRFPRPQEWAFQAQEEAAGPRVHKWTPVKLPEENKTSNDRGTWVGLNSRWGSLASGGSYCSAPSTTALSPGPGVGAGVLRGGAVIAAPAYPAPDSQGTGHGPCENALPAHPGPSLGSPAGAFPAPKPCPWKGPESLQVPPSMCFGLFGWSPAGPDRWPRCFSFLPTTSCLKGGAAWWKRPPPATNPHPQAGAGVPRASNEAPAR